MASKQTPPPQLLLSFRSPLVLSLKMRTLTRLCLSTAAAHPLLSSNNLLLLSSPSSSILTPRRRSHSLSPRCALKQTKKQIAIQKTSSSSSLSSSSSSSSSNGGGDGNLLWFLNPKSEERKDGDGDGDGEESSTAVTGTVLAGLLLVGVVGGFGTVGYLYKDQINDYLTHFSQFIEGYGPAGYAIFVGVYAVLEIFALPAIPLTMSAGLLFGPVVGTILVSISGTLAASISFLIARYFARDRIRKLVEGNKKFLAIDKAIGENGFKVVVLLRLSPLLPFSLGNYLYGLTSVDFVPYVLGSWLGMLPGTWAYVSAGAFGRAIIQEESAVGLPGGNGQLITLAAGLLVTALTATYVTRLAKDAVKDMDE